MKRLLLLCGIALTHWGMQADNIRVENATGHDIYVAIFVESSKYGHSEFLVSTAAIRANSSKSLTRPDVPGSATPYLYASYLNTPYSEDAPTLPMGHSTISPSDPMYATKTNILSGVNFTISGSAGSAKSKKAMGDLIVVAGKK